jgi:hypothetical protein
MDWAHLGQGHPVVPGFGEPNVQLDAHRNSLLLYQETAGKSFENGVAHRTVQHKSQKIGVSCDAMLLVNHIDQAILPGQG